MRPEMRCGQTNHVYFGRSEDSEHFLAQKEGSHSDGISGTDHQGECLQIPWGQETEENVSDRGTHAAGSQTGSQGGLAALGRGSHKFRTDTEEHRIKRPCFPI